MTLFVSLNSDVGIPLAQFTADSNELQVFCCSSSRLIKTKCCFPLDRESFRTIRFSRQGKIIVEDEKSTMLALFSRAANSCDLLRSSRIVALILGTPILVLAPLELSCKSIDGHRISLHIFHSRSPHLLLCGVSSLERNDSLVEPIVTVHANVVISLIQTNKRLSIARRHSVLRESLAMLYSSRDYSTEYDVRPNVYVKLNAKRGKENMLNCQWSTEDASSETGFQWMSEQ